MRATRMLPAIVVLLALLGGPVASIGAPAGSADAMTGQSASRVTFIDQSCVVEEVAPQQDGVIQRIRNVLATCEVTFDDARVSGTVTAVRSHDCHAEAGCATWGTQEITTAGGTWHGSFTGLIDTAFTERAYSVMTGTGNHAGLTFILHAMAPLGEAPTVVGIIYEGEPPPLPDVSGAAAD